MRTTNRLFFLLAAFAGLVAVSASSNAAAIEAVKGKPYRLTKQHGPWMIMVASINKPPENRQGEGISPEEAADEMVYELRRKGIPAYSFKQEQKEADVQTVSRRTNKDRHGRITSQTEGICVLAGNYESSDDRKAQQTLKYVKKYHPQFMQDVAAESPFIKRLKNGGFYRTTPSRPGPLGGAFMTTNPLLSEDEIADRSRDPLLVQLNSDTEYSLLNNKGKYTVVVATFQGKSSTQVAEQVDEDKLKIGSSLNEAGQRLDLCYALRKARSWGYDREFDSYVYHDRFTSMVTVGSFNDPKDPRITEIQNKFGAKIAQVNQDGTPAIGAEVFRVPRKPTAKQKVMTWIFDPYPRVIDVPR